MTALRMIAAHSCSSFAAWNVTPSTLEEVKKVWFRQPIVTVLWLFGAMVWPLFASPNVLLLPGRRSGQEGTLRTVTTDP